MSLQDVVNNRKYNFDFKNGIVTEYYGYRGPIQILTVGMLSYATTKNENENAYAISIDISRGSSKDCSSPRRGNLILYCDNSLPNFLQYASKKPVDCNYNFLIAMNCNEPKLGYQIALPYDDLFKFLSNPNEKTEKYIAWLDYLKNINKMLYDRAYVSFSELYDLNYKEYTEKRSDRQTFYQYICSKPSSQCD